MRPKLNLWRRAQRHPKRYGLAIVLIWAILVASMPRVVTESHLVDLLNNFITKPRTDTETYLVNLLNDFFTGAVVAIFVMLIVPNEVLRILNRSILPFFTRQENRLFPNERFFEIIDSDARTVTQIDIFAHFHAHWLGFSDKKRDTTGHHGTFYNELFSRLRQRAVSKRGRGRNENILLRILFLDYSECSDDVVRYAADILGIAGDTDSETIRQTRAWGESARECFEREVIPEMRALIDAGILSGQSAIRSASFIPTMGVIRLQYVDDNGSNTWLHAEFLTHAAKPANVGENRFTIMLQRITAFGHRDDRISQFDDIIEGEWIKANKTAVQESEYSLAKIFVRIDT